MEEEIEIEKANKWYNRKGFEYFALKNLFESKETLPKLDILLSLSERLIETLQPICFSSAPQTDTKDEPKKQP